MQRSNSTRILLRPIELDQGPVDDGAERDLANKNNMSLLNLLTDIIIAINNIVNSGNLFTRLKRAYFAEEVKALKTKIMSDNAAEALERLKHLNRVIHGMDKRSEVLAILTKQELQQRLRDKLRTHLVTLDKDQFEMGNKLTAIDQLFRECGNYFNSPLSNLPAYQIAVLAYLSDYLIIVINKQLGEFKSINIIAQLKDLLAQLYTTRDELAFCMALNIQAYGLSNQRSTDILLLFIDRLNKLFELPATSLGSVDQFEDDDFRQYVQNPFGDETKGTQYLSINVKDYFDTYITILASDESELAKAQKSFAVTKKSFSVIDVFAVPKAMVNVLLIAPFIQLSKFSLGVITNIQDFFNQIVIEPTKQVVNDISGLVDTRAEKMIDDIGEKDIMDVLEDDIRLISRGSQEPPNAIFPNLGLDIPIDVDACRPLAQIGNEPLFSPALIKQISDYIKRLEDDIKKYKRSCFSPVLNPIVVKKAMKKAALEKILNIEDADVARRALRDYLQDESSAVISGMSSVTQYLLTKALQELIEKRSAKLIGNRNNGVT